MQRSRGLKQSCFNSSHDVSSCFRPGIRRRRRSPSSPPMRACSNWRRRPCEGRHDDVRLARGLMGDAVGRGPPADGRRRRGVHRARGDGAGSWPAPCPTFRSSTSPRRRSTSSPPSTRRAALRSASPWWRSRPCPRARSKSAACSAWTVTVHEVQGEEDDRARGRPGAQGGAGVIVGGYFTVAVAQRLGMACQAVETARAEHRFRRRGGQAHRARAGRGEGQGPAPAHGAHRHRQRHRRRGPRRPGHGHQSQAARMLRVGEDDVIGRPIARDLAQARPRRRWSPPVAARGGPHRAPLRPGPDVRHDPRHGRRGNGGRGGHLPRRAPDPADGGDGAQAHSRHGARRHRALRGHPRIEPGAAPGDLHGGGFRAHAGHGDDPGRDRHREGALRAGHPQCQRAPRRAVRGGQLRGASGATPRERAVRLRAGRVHRRQPEGQGRAFRAGPRRHHLPRRDRRDGTDDAGQAPARAAGEEGHAPGQRPGDPGGRARDRRDQQEPAQACGRRGLPRRSLLPPERAAIAAAGAAQPQGGHRAPGRDLPAPVTRRRIRARALERRVARARAPRLAGQRARAAERDGPRRGDGAREDGLGHARRPTDRGCRGRTPGRGGAERGREDRAGAFANRGRVAETARMLGISRSTLWRRMRLRD